MVGSSLSLCLPHLRSLTLLSLGKCEQLPALGMLPSLGVLMLGDMRSVKRLGEEFYHQQTKPKEDSFFSLVYIH